MENSCQRTLMYVRTHIMGVLLELCTFSSLGTVGRLRYGLNVGSHAANPPPLDAS